MRRWAEALLWDRSPEGPDVFRLKGVLLIAGSPRQHLLQVLGALFSFSQSFHVFDVGSSMFSPEMFTRSRNIRS